MRNCWQLRIQTLEREVGNARSRLAVLEDKLESLSKFLGVKQEMVYAHTHCETKKEK